MGRTQAAVVEGTARCLIAHGVRRTTMVDIATASGVAKGTLYNHVRTKSEAYRLLAEAETERLLSMLRGEPAVALAAAADFIAQHPVARRLVTSDPAALAVVLTPGPLTDGPYGRMREALEDLLGAASPLALRFLSSLIFDPGSAEQRSAVVALLTSPADPD